MSPLPYALYRAEQVRALDRIAIERFQIPGSVLMERAGAAAFRVLLEVWPEARRLVVVCGIGNNAGDGFVLARLAHDAGRRVRVLQLGDPERLQGDALAAQQRLLGAGVVPETCKHGIAESEALHEAEVLVDALFGTGLNAPLEGIWREAAAAINAAPAPVLALDIPSGLHADTGRVLGTAVRAVCTISFIGLKAGLFTGQGPDYVGRVLFDALNVPEEVYVDQTPSAVRLDMDWAQSLLAPRRRTAHKGDFGHVLVIGGERGMTGAVRLAGEAAARGGAGLVSIATRPEHAALVSMARPELMAHGAYNAADLGPLLERADVVAIGPGLGRSDWARGLLACVLQTELPLVLDADALNLLAAGGVATTTPRADWVLTPHPGEAARLLGQSSAELEADRFATLAALQARYGGVVVLKGAGTLVGDDSGVPGVGMTGNPGMASGGMGDVLTGLIAAQVAQGLELSVAARLAVVLHGAAGDEAARQGERGLLAGDLVNALRGVLNRGHETPACRR